MKSGSCHRATRTCSHSAKGKQVALCSARVPLGATRGSHFPQEGVAG
jgi:hypothetical protein